MLTSDSLREFHNFTPSTGNMDIARIFTLVQVVRMFSMLFDVKNQQIVNTTFHQSYHGFVPMVNIQL